MARQKGTTRVVAFAHREVKNLYKVRRFVDRQTQRAPPKERRENDLDGKK